MRRTARRPIAAVALVLTATLIWADDAHAAGAVNIASCQVLDIPNTTYKLTADLTSSSDCLIVAGDRITIDLQGHSITGTDLAVFGFGAITDFGQARDLIGVKNGMPGTLSGFFYGINLMSTRSSVIGVDASNNIGTGIHMPGAKALIKSSRTSQNNQGIAAEGDRSQIQQCDASNNATIGISAGARCLVTMNTANNNTPNPENGYGIVAFGERCTVSFNTAAGNGIAGIFASGTGTLITQNTAMGNGVDFLLVCPSDVTFNMSSLGFPASYQFPGGSASCHMANNQ